MAITPDQYPLLIAAPVLQDYLVDKDLGTPLAGGIITFYHDNARTILKNVYTQTGIPGDYTYIPLANPMTLTSVGTMSDSFGNDIIPYFFPYNEDDDTELDPYYITVYSTTETGDPAVLQFTRENFPFVSQGQDNPSSEIDVPNFIPNSQLSVHYTLDTTGNIFPNGVSSVTLAPGGSTGWTFSKPTGSTDTDVLTFITMTEPPTGLLDNPRFAFNWNCTVSAGVDTFKYFGVTYQNVNTFASTNQLYTFSFAGKSNTGSTTNVALVLVKNFGTGGSASTTTILEEFTLLPDRWDQFSFSFAFGINDGFTIGPNNDDYLALYISFPPTSVGNCSVTNFVLTPGEINFSVFPEVPDFVPKQEVFGSYPTPNPDGSQLYLPVVMTQSGITFDTSVIGRIEANASPNPDGNLLLCDGSQYLTAGYSSLGIPYSRLQKYLANLVTASIGYNNGIGIGGNGATFVNAAVFQDNLTTINLYTNQPGAQTATADGISATGFTFNSIAVGQASTATGYQYPSNGFVIRSNAPGPVTGVNAGTSGFAVAQNVNNNVSYSYFTGLALAASGISAGTYFTFSTPSASYYVWFTINGAGSDPAPGGTGIRVNLFSGYTASNVASLTYQAINGFCVSTIVTAAANTLSPGDYFTFFANSVQYAVWYKIGNAGTAPIGSGTTIQVTLAGTETAAQVAQLTTIAINSLYFAVPDLRGMFLRGLRGDGSFDIDASGRYSTLSGYAGNVVGTIEFDQFQQHTHAPLWFSTGASPGVAGVPFNPNNGPVSPVSISNFSIGPAGTPETYPVNYAINWFIRY